jgi:hypothetical protein
LVVTSTLLALSTLMTTLVAEAVSTPSRVISQPSKKIFFIGGCF